MTRKDRCDAHRYRRYMRVVRRTRENPHGTERPVWKCFDCPHLLYNADELVGRHARCYTCKEHFTIAPQHLRLAGFEKGHGLTGGEGWRVKIICGGDCLENLKKHSGLGELTLEQIMKKSLSNALRPTCSESEQEHSLLADLVKQAHEGE